MAGEAYLPRISLTPGHHLLGLAYDVHGHLLQLLAPLQLKRHHPPLLGFGGERRITEGLGIGVTQDLHAIGRNTRRNGERTSEVAAGEDYRGDGSNAFRGIVLLHQLVDGGGILESGVTLLPGLNQRPRKLFLVPGQVGLTPEEWRDGQASARHLITLHRQVDLAAAGVTRDELEVRSHGLLEHLAQEIAVAARAGVTQLGRGHPSS